MKNDGELAKKNLEISFEFSRYLLSNPTLQDRIPDNALIVFDIADDPELTKYNRALARSNREAHQRVVTVHIQGIAPTRLLKPTVTVGS